MKIKAAPGETVLVIPSGSFQPRPTNQKGRPKNPPQFEVKAADGGYSLFLSIPKSDGEKTRSKDTRRMFYCCFITPDELPQVELYDFDQMADFALGRIERRKATERTDPAKLAAIASTIEGLIAPHQLAAAGD